MMKEIRNLTRFPEIPPVKKRTKKYQVIAQAERCLTVAEHWLHASTRFSRRGARNSRPAMIFGPLIKPGYFVSGGFVGAGLVDQS